MKTRIAKKVVKRATEGGVSYTPGKVARAQALVERGAKRIAKHEAAKKEFHEQQVAEKAAKKAKKKKA